jgi:Zn-dependent protease
MHPTFLLLLGLVLIMPADAGGSVPGGPVGVALVVLVFACVVFHELGHSLTARKFGLEVASITLLPIGGMAAMRTLPKKPGQELLIALAGPAVSLVLAVIFGCATYYLYGLMALQAFAKAPLLGQLAYINVILAMFNLLPAFPMDGGRIVRSLLWMKFGFVRATTLAAHLGQGLAIVMFFLAINHNYMLILVAVFVYLGAMAEGRAAQWRGILGQIPAAEAMRTRLVRVAPNDTIGQASQLMMHAGQDHFPVFHNEAFIGLLTREGLFRGLSEHKHDQPISEFMTTRIVYCSPLDSLANVFQSMNEKEVSCVVVMEADRLAGLITVDQLGKFGLPVRSADG